MAIDKSGRWWVGSTPTDLKEYLSEYMAQGYGLSEFRLCQCVCGSAVFRLHADDENGVARRTCIHCKQKHYIADSEEFWEEGKPKLWKCAGCNTKEANVGVGYSLRGQEQEIYWIDIGVRCNQCGTLVEDWT